MEFIHWSKYICENWWEHIIIKLMHEDRSMEGNKIRELEYGKISK